MERKASKIIGIILIIIMLMFIVVQPKCYAADATAKKSFTITDIINKGKDFIDGVQPKSDISSNVQELSKSIASILQFISIIVAVIMISILGIKYITGSVEMQADIKKTLMPFIIGSVMAFGAFTIWKIVIEVLQGTSL